MQLAVLPIFTFLLLQGGLIWALIALERRRGGRGRRARLILSAMIAMLAVLIFVAGGSAFGWEARDLGLALVLGLILAPGAFWLGGLLAPQLGRPGWQGWLCSIAVVALLIALGGGVLGTALMPGFGTAVGAVMGFALVASGPLSMVVTGLGVIAVHLYAHRHPEIRRVRDDSVPPAG